MSPNKSKRGTDDSPEERKSKRKKTADDNEEEEEKEASGSISKMKIPAHLSNSSHKPAELFRKDLISAMKLPDSESLAPEEYLLIADSWRQEWERGVQVPVNEDGLPAVDLREVNAVDKTTGDFKMPKKMLHSCKDETFRQGCHELTGMSQLAEQVVRYDLDDLDVSWLQRVNEEREEIGEILIYEWTVERVIEALETKCHENMEIKKKTEEGLGIEYDEDIVCEICRSPDSEDSNEMVFCDGCDICVHQACYGIATVPEGSWLCRTCALGVKPACILCPNQGGAMKSTRSGSKWAHVSCAIWIPEVTIGCVEKMEPITKISEIPASRWALVCTLCKERTGACIQCSVKACKTAFHVTCGFANNLEMKTILIEDTDDDDDAVKLKAYCPKHSKKRDRVASESETDSPRKSVCGTPKKEMSDEEKAKIRAERLQRLEEEFYSVINVHELATSLEIDQGIIDLIYVYWKLKRKALHNRPLLTPKTEEADLLEKQQEDSLVARMKMFVHLRQDLERVRNLSYMISRREKMKRSFNKCRENVFYAAVAMLTDESLKLKEKDVHDVVKQYNDIPSQTCAAINSGKAIPVKGFLTDLESESDTGLRKSGKGLVSKNKKKLMYESDSDAVSVSSAISSVSPEAAPGIKGKRTRKPTRKSSEMPGPKLKEGRRSGSKTVDVKDVKAEEKMDTDLTESDLNNSIAVDNSVTDTTTVNTSIDNSVDMDTSDVTEDVKLDQTLVKSDMDTSSQDNTLVKSQLDTSTDDNTDKKDSVKPDKGSPGRRKAGRPPKIKSDTGHIETKVIQENESAHSRKLDNKKSDVRKSISSRTRSLRNEKSLPEDMVTEEHTAVSEKLQPQSGVKMKSNQKHEVKDSLEEVDFVSKTEIKAKEGVKSPSPSKLSPDRSLFESMEKDLMDIIPSARNVSKDIKAELTGYFRNNKLCVSEVIKQKVQSSLLNCRRNRHFANGIHITAQKSLDSLFNASHGECETTLQNGTDRTVSRVLNELSPTRDRLESNNLLSKKLDCDRLSDRVRTRSSRDTSPDSLHGSDISSHSTSSLRRSSRSFKRSNSRTSTGKDSENEFIDVENIFEESVKRKTRSMDIDDRKLKERSLSPATLLKKNTQRIIS